MAGGNPFHNALLDDLIGQFPAGPLADWTTALAGGLTGQGHDLANLLWGDPGGSPGTRRIPQSFFQAQVCQRGCLQPQPAVASEPYRIHSQAHLAGDLAVVQASRGRKNDSASPGQLLRGARPAYQGFQSLLFLRR